MLVSHALAGTQDLLPAPENSEAEEGPIAPEADWLKRRDETPCSLLARKFVEWTRLQAGAYGGPADVVAAAGGVVGGTMGAGRGFSPPPGS